MGAYTVRSEYIDARGIAWDADAVSIFVLEGIMYRGQQASISFALVPFEDFAKNRSRERLATTSGPRAEWLSRSAMDALQLEFPWLALEDFAAAASTCVQRRRLDNMRRDIENMDDEGGPVPVEVDGGGPLRCYR